MPAFDWSYPPPAHRGHPEPAWRSWPALTRHSLPSTKHRHTAFEYWFLYPPSQRTKDMFGVSLIHRSCSSAVHLLFPAHCGHPESLLTRPLTAALHSKPSIWHLHTAFDSQFRYVSAHRTKEVFGLAFIHWMLSSADRCRLFAHLGHPWPMDGDNKLETLAAHSKPSAAHRQVAFDLLFL